MSVAKKILLAMTYFLISSHVMAVGGLTDATNAAEDIKDWLYTFLGVGCFIYLMYNIIMAKLERKSWSDVLIALVHVAIAGGSIAAATWAWGIFA